MREAPGALPAACFEIGFVLAGAVSAGCYSAGVMDFIIEALDDYYRQRDAAGWDGPTHDVRVPVLTGASAGGMTAGMVGLHLFRDLAHVWPGEPPPMPAANRLYSSWVTDISIEKLLATSDLEGGKTGLRSALCSDALDRILKDAFDIAGPARQRPWVGRADGAPLQVMLTLTNLQGVPYSFPLVGPGGGGSFGMLNHADIVSFGLGIGPSAPGAKPWLDVTQVDTPLWDTFRMSALATGAFPVGLASCPITRPASDYAAGLGSPFRYTDATTGLPIPVGPDASFAATGTVTYWAVDGGTMNNEPLEQARRYLTDGGPERRDGGSADHAVVMVAPFPHAPRVGELQPRDGTLAAVLPRLFTALINQARFKPEELAKAHDGTDFSRFVIAPVRQRADRTVPEFPIASGAIGGFSGFLDESFRRHDYLLGRRNAQAFLRWNFALPRTHALFADKAIADTWLVRDASQQVGTVAPGADAALAPRRLAVSQGATPSEHGYPIIPLTPRMQAAIEIEAADQPHPSPAMLEPLLPAIRQRIRKAVGVLVDVDFMAATAELGPIIGPLVRQGARMYGTQVTVNLVAKQLKKDLTDLAGSFP